MARTQQQRREETRARLLDAAIETIVEVGYARASAAVIAPALSTAKGMNKQDAFKAAANALPSMPREEFDEIQTMLLRTVVKLVETNGVDMPVPVIKADGSFTDEDLCYDAPTVMQLSVQALMFNIGDFFQGAGLIQKPAK